MNTINLLLKPASGSCNMRCHYCFYADETARRTVKNYGMMSESTIRGVLAHLFEAKPRQATVAFQGGEPTLAGLPFFRRAVALCQELNTCHTRVQFALQTNGLLIDEEWCRFFAEEHFLIGVSLDGPKELHDANRVDAAGAGTYTRVLHALQLLKQHGVDTNILTVLSATNARSFNRLAGFYRRSGFAYQQYIPCLDPLGEVRGGHPWSLTPALMETYLKSAFDCWYNDLLRGRRWYHRYFDNLLIMLDGQPPEACGMCGICGMQYVVEADGSTFPCDFYMLDEYRLGNLAEESLAALDKRRAAIEFVAHSAQPDPACSACPWYTLCRGGCRRDRDYFEAGIGKNYYCTAYQHFFAYSVPRLQQAYRMLAGR